MTKYAPVIKEILDCQYPNRQVTSFVAINSVNCQFLSPQSARFLEAYGSLKTLMMSHCDMRNLDNFPRLPLLVDLDLSHNSLQGSFNNLMILTNLEYLNISNNFVSDVSRLQPLRKLEKIVVCVKDNPFLAKDGWKIKLKQYGVKLAKDPKPMQTKPECKLEVAEEKKQIEDKPKLEEKQSGLYSKYINHFLAATINQKQQRQDVLIRRAVRPRKRVNYDQPDKVIERNDSTFLRANNCSTRLEIRPRLEPIATLPRQESADSDLHDDLLQDRFQRLSNELTLNRRSDQNKMEPTKVTNESKNNRFPAYFNFMNKDEDEGNLRCLLGFEVQIQKPEDNSPQSPKQLQFDSSSNEVDGEDGAKQNHELYNNGFEELSMMMDESNLVFNQDELVSDEQLSNSSNDSDESASQQEE